MDIENLLEIILITYNRRQKLQATLKQLFADNSPVKHLQLTILDNNSNDGSAELIQDYAKKFANIKHIVNNRNIGGNGNIVKAFENASKKYVWVICDDDMYNWSGWSKIKQAILEDYDVIFTRKLEKNWRGVETLGSIFCGATFLPACIYKTSNITDTVMFNMFNNVPNFFPHLALLAKNINDDNRFYFTDTNIVDIGVNTDGAGTYYRGMRSEEIPVSNRKTFWTVGYYCSVELIKDRKKQIEIIDNPVYPYKSLYQNFLLKIFLNKSLYGDYFYNYYKMFRILSFKQKCVFAAAFIKSSFFSVFFDAKKSVFSSPEQYRSYVSDKKTGRYIKKLIKKYKNKKVLVYGAGTMADYFFEEFDFSTMNIVGVADRKFSEKNISFVYGYKAVKPEDIEALDCDVILFSVVHPEKIEKELRNKGSKKKFAYMVKKRFGYVV